jgi:Tol biopolymer transport system component
MTPATTIETFSHVIRADRMIREGFLPLERSRIREFATGRGQLFRKY